MEDREYHLMHEVERTHWWFVSRRMFVRALLDQIIPNKSFRIADIGAGTGGMVKAMTRYGKVTAVEPHPLARALSRGRGIRMKPGNAHTSGLPTAAFDLVCFFDVLYHRGIDEKRALKEAYRVLKPGGLLMITDAAIPWLAGPHDVAVHGRTRYYLSQMTGFVTASGFRIRTARYAFFLVFPLVVIKRILDRLYAGGRSASDVSRVHPLVNRLLTVLGRVETACIPYVWYPWGSSVVVIAQKYR